MDTYGVIGWPIKHSLSPAMHNAAFKELGIQNKAKYIKIPVDPDNLENFLLGNKSEKDTDGNNIHVKDLSGFNITIPHKIKAREILQKKFHIVKDSDFKSEYIYYDNISRAINTVIRKDGKVSTCVRFDPHGLGIIGDCTKMSLIDIWHGARRIKWLKCHIKGRRQEIKCRYIYSFAAAADVYKENVRKGQGAFRETAGNKYYS